jgi:hypothetical protein
MIWVENKVRNPPRIKNIISNDRNAASNLLMPQDSNFSTTGNNINEINNAKLSGINTGLARIITAKRPNIKANVKNNFGKDSVISLSKGVNWLKN